MWLAGTSNRMTQISHERVLVTGASGFIGSHLSRRLLARGYEVHAITRSNALPADAGAISHHQGELGDVAFLRSLVTSLEPVYAFHLASAVTGARGLEAILPTLHGNLVAAVNLMTVLAGTSCRQLVIAGSQEEPDWGSAETPCSPYAAGKWAASGYARMFHELYSLPVVVARVFMVYGPAQRDRSKLVPYLIDALLRGETPRLSSGTRPVDWIYVDDVVEGLIDCALKAPAGSTVDLGSGRLVTIREMVELLVKLINLAVQPRFGALPDRPLERVRRADAARTREICGWSPQISLREGLLRTIDWHRDQA